MKNQEILLFSNGLDSHIAYHYLKNQGKNILPLYLDFHGLYSNAEIEHIMRYSGIESVEFNHHSISLGDIEDPQNFNIPYRNILLSVLCAAKYGNKIWNGQVIEDMTEDGKEKTFLELSKFLTTVNKTKVEILSPFFNIHKKDIVDWYINNIAAPHILAQRTFSCFNPLKNYRDVMCKYSSYVSGNSHQIIHSKECFSCNACFRKCVALFSDNLVIIFENLDLIKEYKKKFEEGKYDPIRTKLSLDYIKFLNH
tara:strand:+ start:2323 stop:3081 length:759 start_codon:yes stop_codon:yes gene_type:complete